MKYIVPVLALYGLMSCTKLDEKLNNALTPEQATASNTADGLLKSAYYSMNPALIDQAGWMSLTEHTSDEYCGPTRATNWDDNGVWRVLHQHAYDANHTYITATFEGLLVMQYNASNVLNFSPNPSQAAEARFLRAYSMYLTLSGWGQVPFRDYNVPLSAVPPVYRDTAALDFIISELNAILPTLPAHSAVPSTKANQDAAKFLLMKCYLNRGTYENRTSPTFDPADMQQVITLADGLTGYTLTANYYDNFSPTSLTASTENIFGFVSTPASDAAGGNNVRSRWYCGLNYNNNPGGWNGFCTLSDFYDKFENTDIRKSYAYPGLAATSGLNAGFLIGQQKDKSGNPINVSSSLASGPPLVFLAAISPTLQETDPATLDITGIRVIKFVPDYQNVNDPSNELPFFRYADVLLMKAEAAFRSGDDATALTILNQIKTARGASTITTVTDSEILDERGRELYTEMWRREDQIRFGTFLQANQAKPAASDPKYLLFPIPANDLAANPNLVQNDGFGN